MSSEAFLKLMRVAHAGHHYHVQVIITCAGHDYHVQVIITTCWSLFEIITYVMSGVLKKKN